VEVNDFPNGPAARRAKSVLLAGDSFARRIEESDAAHLQGSGLLPSSIALVVGVAAGHAVYWRVKLSRFYLTLAVA
jgi:hypothetical protein